MESSVNDSGKKIPIEEASTVCQLEELLAYGSSYLNAKLGGIKSSTKQALMGLFIEVSFIFFGMMSLLIALVFLMYGIALAIGTVLGDKTWLGFIITGGTILVAKLLFSKIILAQDKKDDVKKKIKDYECELDEQRKKFGHDMRADASPSKESLKDEGEFLIWKAALAKSAFLEKGRHLKHDLSGTRGVRKLTRKYPFYSTGAAAATGFIVAGAIASKPSQKSDDLKSILSTAQAPDGKKEHIEPIKLALVALISRLAEDVLKDVMIPIVKENLPSFLSDESLAQSKNQGDRATPDKPMEPMDSMVTEDQKINTC